jgi:hypothetical protein
MAGQIHREGRTVVAGMQLAVAHACPPARAPRLPPTSACVALALLDEAERLAREDGATELACDTSEHASELRATYSRRGYREVGFVRWDVTNYRSVILSKTLA